MTVYVDRPRLRELAKELPPEAQAAAIEKCKAEGLRPPSWDGYDAEEAADDLLKCAQAIAAGAASVGYTLNIPIRTDVYEGWLKALPPDLLDAVELECRNAGVPHVAHAAKWSVAHAEVTSTACLAAADELRARLRRLNGAIAGAKFSDQRQGAELDAERHALAAWVSRGRTTSSKELMPFEHDHLVDLLERDATGMIELEIMGMDANGVSAAASGPTLLDRKTGEILSPPVVDWKATAKAAGMTQAHLKGRASELADKLRLPKPPAKPDEWDARLTAAMLRSLMVDATVAMAKAAFPGATVEGEPDTPASTSPIPREPADGAPNDVSTVLTNEPTPAPHLPANGTLPNVSPAAADAFVLVAVPTSLLGAVLDLIGATSNKGVPA